MHSGSRKAKITQTLVDRLPAEAAKYTVADTEIAGFWLVVAPTGRKSYMFRYRISGGRSGTTRQPKIGEWPAMKVEKARAIAREWAAAVRLGGDPSAERQSARAAPRMSELFQRYLDDHARPKKKASSVAEDERMIRLQLEPVFGRRKVAEVTRAEIDRFHKGLQDTPYMANRALALLSKMFNLAEVWGWRPDGSNPASKVSRFKEAKRKRYLSPAELAALGDALRRAERDGFLELPVIDGVRAELKNVPISIYSVAAIRLLVFTGARLNEILSLRWHWIDFEARRAELPDSKTGDKPLILPPAALKVLSELPRVEGNPHVIVGLRRGASLVNIAKPWAAICEAAGLENVRIHDLRHSFASVGAAGGASLTIIGALLGHQQPATTARYAHLADDPLQAVAADISGRIEAAMAVDSALRRD